MELVVRRSACLVDELIQSLGGGLEDLIAGRGRQDTTAVVIGFDVASQVGIDRVAAGPPGCEVWCSDRRWDPPGSGWSDRSAVGLMAPVRDRKLAMTRPDSAPPQQRCKSPVSGVCPVYAAGEAAFRRWVFWFFAEGYTEAEVLAEMRSAYACCPNHTRALMSNKNESSMPPVPRARSGHSANGWPTRCLSTRGSG